MESALLTTYARSPLAPRFVFVRGEGPWLFDAEGRRYLDFGSGIAVTALGHGHPVLKKALLAQAEELWHASNLFHTEPAERLACQLVDLSFASKVFLCNSGTEANEAALKFACLHHASRNEASTRTRLVAFERAFHGRTCGALSTTANPQYRVPFAALRGADAVFAPFNATEGLENIITRESLAVFLEPVQGEGGVHPATEPFLQKVRALCDATGTPLVFDEIQCGLGRTGHLFAHEAYRQETGAALVPDILTLAKPLAGGLPCGAVLVNAAMADAVKPGSHGSTFGGNPLACAVASAFVSLVAQPELLASIRTLGLQMNALFARLARKHPDLVLGVRGRGLMWGVDLGFDAAVAIEAARARGVVLLSAGPRTLRFLPPFLIDSSHLEILEETLEWVLANVSASLNPLVSAELR
ncbi:MAG: acetylornithine transaminase [Silvanigrellales bacterium]|nr:acetylornithine transaminase [Silvanigrellales bacterium]